MADEKSVQQKNTGKPSFGTRFVNFFKNLPANIARPFRDMFYELKKVTWPSGKATLKNVGIVIACVIAVGICIWVFDFIAREVVQALLKLFS